MDNELKIENCIECDNIGPVDKDNKCSVCGDADKN
jgi:hypothetical protein